MPVPFYLYCIGFSLLMGIIHYRGLKSSMLQWFVPFLAITFVTETLAVYLKYVRHSPNGALYNIYIWLQVTFFAWFYWTLGMKKPYRLIICFTTLLYGLATIYIYLFYAPLADFNIGLFLSGGFLVTLFAIFFLFNYFSLDDQLQEQQLVPVLWVTIGIVAYFTVLSLTVSLYKYILLYNLEVGGVKLHNATPRIMSVFMYLSFAYAFYLCRKKKQK